LKMARSRSASKKIKRQTYTVLVENEPGVLARISGLFSARGFNIVSLAVGETLDRGVSRMTLVAEGTEIQLEQINKQLNKLIPVISVRDLKTGDYASRELLLVKINKSEKTREFIKKHRAEHQWMIIDESPEHFIVQVVVTSEEVDVVLKELSQFGVSELCRTGQIAMAKKYKIGIKNKRK
jgi:acetolactate synthase I/III small subunit